MTEVLVTHYGCNTAVVRIMEGRVLKSESPAMIRHHAKEYAKGIYAGLIYAGKEADITYAIDEG